MSNIRQKCFSCKFWQKIYIDEQVDLDNIPETLDNLDNTDLGYCRFHTPESTKSDIIVSSRRKGCVNWEAETKYQKYIKSRMLDRHVIHNTMGLIIDQKLGREELVDVLTQYYFGRVPQFVYDIQNGCSNSEEDYEDDEE